MNQILTQEGRSLRGEHGEGILWSKYDAFAQVIGAECCGRVHRVGFGPTSSGRSASKLSCYTSTPLSSSETTHRIIELENSLAFVMDQLSHSEERHQQQLAQLDAWHKEQLAEALAQSDAKHKEQMTEMILHIKEAFAQFSPLMHSTLPSQCHNGHILYSTCKTRVQKQCPTCRQELGDRKEPLKASRIAK